ncbi:MAG: heavy metal translocating P-type ATPase [Promethearchaeota archaeon]
MNKSAVTGETKSWENPNFTTLDPILDIGGGSCEEVSGCSATGCSCSSVSMTISEKEKKTFEFKKKIFPLILSILLAILGFVLELFNPFNINIWIIYGIFGSSYLISSYEVIRSVFRNLNPKTVFDENFLMFIATVGGILTNDFLEAIAVMIFYKVGQIVEDYGVFKSKKSITALLEKQPSIANLKTQDGFKQLHPKEIQVGDVLLVKPGEKIPLDGKMITSHSMCDTSALTGESIPRRISEGDTILAGMINISHLIEYQVTKTYENSAISRILDLVQNAESNKSVSEKFTRKFARYYTPIVVVAALLLAIIPPLIIPEATFSDWTYRAMIFLVISCPCALVISVPLTYFGGIGGASRHGILIKGTQHLETLAALDTMVFDKTGTITKGNFMVTRIVPLDGFLSEEFLEMVASIEAYSNHPIASSIIEYYGEDKLTKLHSKFEIENFKELPALGVVANLDGKQIVAGNDKILHKYEIPHHHDYCKLEGTVVHVGLDSKYLGYLEISDEIKEDSSASFANLRRLGINKMVILSGDEESIVKNLAKDLKIDEYHAGLMPEEKVHQFKKIKSQNNSVGYAGDGINDAPVIALADVGFAMGGFGSDVAIEAADVVLMTDSISKIVQAIQIARQTRKINWENIGLIFLVKFAFLTLGAFGMMSMWGAVFADVGMALIAILNSRRMLSFIPKPIFVQ